MLDKLDKLEERYHELGALISDPEIIANTQKWQQYVKSHAELGGITSSYQEYKRIRQEIEDAREMLQEQQDPEFKELVETELEELLAAREKQEKELKLLLLPRDPNDEKNVIMEIRAGTGGEEAALFAGDLYRMYLRYAEHHGWKVDIMDTNNTDLGGIKEVVFMLVGKGAYSRLKFESGVHRVQRVPSTESGGRIHTSAATVAVLPEAEDVDVAINPEELRVDVFCSSGPGGQSVNTTQSAVRITHVPTGIVVSMQDEKSQHKNKDKAMKVLRARLMDLAQQEQQQEMASTRKSQVGTGDRSERIRTYNFPQTRVTDHRINFTSHRLPQILTGELDEIIDALVTTDQAERLKQVDE